MKAKQKRKSPAQTFFNRAESDPNVLVVNFDKLMNESPTAIEGSAADLIRDGYDVPQPWLHNGYARPDDRRAAFLIGRGWSATAARRQRIYDAGIPVMAINDFPASGPKPDYWCSGDPANYFGERIWSDIEVMKFCAFENRDHARPRDDAYAPKLLPKDAPNVHFFHEVNNEMEMEGWLHTPWVAWGTSLWGPNVPHQLYSKGCARSSMLIGLRLLWHLGYRRVFLLGCDCTPHHSPYPEYWNTIFHLLNQLRPTFDRYGYDVRQCNVDSHLRSFRFADFEEVVRA